MMNIEHATVAEAHVLAALLTRPESLDEIPELRPEDFTKALHRDVFAAIVRLAAAGEGIDIFTAAEEAGCDFHPLAEYARNLPGANVKSYARIVREAAMSRRLMSAAQQIGEIAHGEAAAAEKLDAAQTLVMSLAEEAPTHGPRPIRDVLLSVVDGMDKRFNADGKLIGLATSFADLDKKTAGLQPGDLVIVAARPSMGKTTLAMNIARNVTLDGGRVLVFSMEMSAEQLLDREVAAIGNIDYEHIRTGRMTEEDWAKYTTAIAQLRGADMSIDDSPALTITEIRSRARRMHRMQPLQLVVVDYLQLARGTSDNRTIEVQQISQGLKALAKELHCPVIALSQLNRALEQRQNRRPRMSDLRDSGSIEQDADLILFLYRDEVYDENTQYRGMAELIIGKQRNGPTGMMPLTFLGHRCRFADFADVWPEERARQPRRGGFE